MNNYPNFLKEQYARFSKGKRNKPDNPDKAAYRNFIQTVDPAERRVPKERLFRVQKNISNGKYSTTRNEQWDAIPTDMGGRTRALAWDPNDPDTLKVWAGSVSGGLWYNDNIMNESSSWHAAGDFWPSLSVSVITFDPNNTETMYVGTGEAETAVITYRESGGRGAGIMKSTDAGATWQLLESTEDFFYVTDIVVRDENGQSVIYAGVTSGVYMGDAHNSEPSNGLYRSEDGGATWTQVLPETDGTGVSPVSDIALTVDGRIFAGTSNNVEGEKGSEIFYSDTGTEGTWTRYSAMADQIVQQSDYNLTGRVKLATAPSDANYVYAVFSVGSVDYQSLGFPTWEGKYILQSTDKGATWTEMNIPNGGSRNWAYLAWHALIIKVSPDNPEQIWAGGLDLHRSDDGGTNWTQYSDWVGMYYGGGEDYVHADQHAIAYRPGTSDVAIFGCDGGVFYTDNADDNTIFAEHNKDFNTLQFYSGKISPFEGNNNSLGGLQDNGSLFYQGEPLSPDAMVSGGDGGYCYFDSTKENAFISSVYENQLMVYESSYNNHYISDYTSGTFTSPFAVNFTDEIIYANAMDFYGDHQDELLIISDFYGNYEGEFVEVSSGSEVPFSYISLSPYRENDRLIAGNSAGRLFQIDFTGSSINSTDITGNAFPEGFISSINYADSKDTMLVTFSNYGVPSVWLTLNSGETWKNCEGNLPDIPVRFALFHPDNSRQVMLATESGLWETRHIFRDTIEWALREEFPFVRTDMLDVCKADNKLLAATHGRGLFTTTWEEADYSGIDAGNIAKLNIAPNPVKSGENIQIKIPVAGNYKIIISGTSGKILNRKKGYAGAGESVSVKMHHHGMNIIGMQIGGQKYTAKVLVKK